MTIGSQSQKDSQTGTNSQDSLEVVSTTRSQTHLDPNTRKTSVSGIKILGTGLAGGSKKVLNEDLAEKGYDSDWIVQRTGILSRYHVAEGEATSDLAVRAAERCLQQANVDPAEVDLILVGTISPDHYTPSTACLVQARLGVSGGGDRHQRGLFRIHLRFGDGQSVCKNRLQPQSTCHRCGDIDDGAKPR